MSANNDKEILLLLDACIAGSEKAQLRIYELYFKAMFRTAVRIVRDNAQAEDVMQESFLAAFSKLHQYKREVTFGAWLKKIVVNKSIQAYQKAVKENWVPIEDLYTLKDTPSTSELEEDTSRKMKLIAEKIETLNDRYRTALHLHVMEGYDYEELSEILEISEGNCRTLISRAKEQLKQKLIIDPRWKTMN